MGKDSIKTVLYILFYNFSKFYIKVNNTILNVKKC